MFYIMQSNSLVKICFKLFLGFNQQQCVHFTYKSISVDLYIQMS
jgi:hypothetical protein